jgi:hypothetical protein
MNPWTRFGLSGVVMLALGGMLLFSPHSKAGDEVKRMKDVQAIADAVKDGKMDMAKDLAKKLAKKEKDDGVENVMALMKARDAKTKSFGFGKTPGEFGPDGIELQLKLLGRDLISGAKMKKEKEALEEMAYRIHGIAQFAEYLPPEKDKGKANKKNWAKYVQDMQEAAVDLEKAVKSESPAELKKAASKVEANCNQCHSIFKG